MTDEMKLLRAFIEASGYDVEEVMGKKFSGTLDGNYVFSLVVTDYKVTKRCPKSIKPLSSSEVRALLDPNIRVNGLILRVDDE